MVVMGEGGEFRRSEGGGRMCGGLSVLQVELRGAVRMGAWMCTAFGYPGLGRWEGSASHAVGHKRWSGRARENAPDSTGCTPAPQKPSTLPKRLRLDHC